MEERKRMFLLLGGAALLIVGAIIVVIFFVKGTPQLATPRVNDENTNIIPTETTSGVSQGTAIPAPPTETFPEEDTGERYARQFAKIFVERFGSFSSDNRNQHIEDVLPLTTAVMAGWVETQTQAQDAFYSQTTILVSSDIQSYTEAQAAIVGIGVQQVIEDESGKRTEYKKGRIELVYVNNNWLVDGLYWE